MFPSIFMDVFPIFQNQKTNLLYSPNLVSESLACCLKSSEFYPDSYHSFPIHFLCKVSPTITVMYKFVIFPIPFSAQYYLIGVVILFFVYVSEKRTANIRWMLNWSPMLAIKGTPADHDAQIYCLGLTLSYFSLSFFMDCILWLYQTQGLFIICAHDTDVTKNLYSKQATKNYFFQSSTDSSRQLYINPFIVLPLTRIIELAQLENL